MHLTQRIPKWWKCWAILMVAFLGLLVFCLYHSGITWHGGTSPCSAQWLDVHSNKLTSGLLDITSVVFTPDSKELLVVSGNGKIKRVDVYSGKIKETIHAKKYLRRVTLSPKGDILYGVRYCYGDIYRLDLTTEKPLSQLKTPGSIKTTMLFFSYEDRFEPVNLALSSNGKILAAGCLNHIVPIWDITTGKRTHVFYGHSGSVDSVSFSPDNSILATVSRDQCPGAIVLWDVKSGKCKKTITDGIALYVKFATFLSNDCLAAGTEDLLSSSGLDEKYNGMSLKVWSVTSGKVLQTLTGHTNRIEAIVALSKEKFLTASADDTIRLWDLKTGNHRVYQVKHDDATTAVEMRSMAISPDHKYLAVGFLGSESYYKLWKLSDLFPETANKETGVGTGNRESEQLP